MKLLTLPCPKEIDISSYWANIPVTISLRLVCDGFIGIFDRGSTGLLVAAESFLGIGQHRVPFYSDLKPDAAFLIAIWSPINWSMPGRCPVGHRTHRAVPCQILGNPDNLYISHTPPRRRPGLARLLGDAGREISQTSLATWYTTDSCTATVRHVRISQHPA